MKRTAILLTAALTAGALSLNTHAQMTAPPGVLTPAPGAAAPGAAPSAPAGSSAPTAPAQSAPSQRDPMTSEFRDCVKTSKEAMEAKKQEDLPAILACLTAEVKRQEGRVSSAVARAAKSLTGDEKQKLDSANTAWRTFRNANCNFYADPKGAPPANLENADCLLNLTVGRAQEMEMLSANAARRAEAKSSGKAGK